VANRQPEIVDLVYPLKGPSGSVAMGLNLQNGYVIKTNGATSLRASEGSLVFVALNRTAHGAVVTECKLQLLEKQSVGDLIAAIYALSAKTKLGAKGLRAELKSQPAKRLQP
jgi:hypothetical protein